MLRIIIILIFLVPSLSSAFMTDESISFYQRVAGGWPVGDRIAFWAEQFLETPYDPDPLGCYVRDKSIVADEKVDCMYLAFRAVELALAADPSHAVEIALDKRFRGRGVIEEGKILNYDDRFQYGEDMIESGKWGREITAELGRTEAAKGSRGRDSVRFVSRKNMMKHKAMLRSGDIIFFVRNPSRRVADEIIGHIGIIKEEQGSIYMIHARGLKNKGGKVRKTLLADYIKTMPFIGIRATRFEQENPMPE
jgi:hypothetical protein